MAIVDTFNAGARRANVDSQSYMASFDADATPKPGENFQQGQAVPDPVFDEKGNSDAFMDKMIEGNDRKGTLMETMYSNRSYKADVKTDLKRDPNKVIKDGQNVAKEASGGMQEVKKQQASFKEDFTQAKSEATQMLKDAAKDMDINPDDAVDQMVAKGEKSNIGMLANAAVMAGGGSLATAGAAIGSVKVELSQQDKKLSVKDQKSLLEDTLKRLQESRKPLDSRQEAGGGKADAEATKESPKQSEIAWEDMKEADLAELLKADPEGADQKESLDLAQKEYELNEVFASHDDAQRRYGDNITADKVEQSVSSGNGAMEKMQADAQEVMAFDGTHTGLVGDSVAGLGGSVVASNPDLDTSSLATRMNMDELDPDAANKLDPGISMRV